MALEDVSLVRGRDLHTATTRHRLIPPGVHTHSPPPSPPRPHPCRFLTEQVSHHPPVSAIYADGLSELGGGYVLHGEVELRTKFWGRSIQLLLAGHCQLSLPGSGDRFIWNRPPMSVNDIILGEQAAAGGVVGWDGVGCALDGLWSSTRHNPASTTFALGSSTASCALPSPQRTDCHSQAVLNSCHPAAT